MNAHEVVALAKASPDKVIDLRMPLQGGMYSSHSIAWKSKRKRLWHFAGIDGVSQTRSVKDFVNCYANCSFELEPELGPDDIEPAALAAMRERVRPGTRWAAFRNADMGHRDLGRLSFLLVGSGCTFADPPKHAPDSAEIGLGWRYPHCGYVNLETGKVEGV
jgi:hypothetical protein